MRVRCVAEHPTPEQTSLLGRLYQGPKQSFGVVVGMEYLVFAMSVVQGTPLVDIAQEFDQLISVPLLLFEITDPHVPEIWEVQYREDGALLLWPPSFLARDSYHVDLLDQVPSVVADFRRVRDRLEVESRIRSI